MGLRSHGNRIQLNSLRTRYFLVTILLTGIVISSAFFANIYVDNAGNLSTANLESRNEVLHISRLIRNSVWEAEAGLQGHALRPSPKRAKIVIDKIDTAIYQAKYLRAIPWVSKDNLHLVVESLITNFESLRNETTYLMRVREDNELLYPAMAIMVDDMLPINVGFYTAASLAMEEFELAGNFDATYRLFTDIRHQWSRMISIFRVYAANRTGIFGDPESGLVAQSANLEVYHKDIMAKLRALEKLRLAKKLDLQAAISLKQMLELAPKWHSYYQQVVSINASDQWRVDLAMVRESIRPLLSNIRSDLLKLDRHLERSAAKDVGKWANVAESVTLSFWTLAIVAMFFIIVGYLSFARGVLRPIALVAKALKAESKGEQQLHLPVVRTTETQNLVAAFSEMRKQVHERQMQLEHQALHDALTGLPNRKFLINHLINEIHHAAEHGERLALLMLDLDRFKEINDTLGHNVGDQVLVRAGQHLLNIMAENGVVARLGGDEFAFVLSDIKLHQQAVVLTQEILYMLEKIEAVEDYKIYVGGSIGIVFYPEHGQDAHTLIQRADVAMYEAKKNSTRYAFYDINQDEYSISRLTLVRDLRNAIDTHNLELFFQPKTDVATGLVVGVEALLRWRHPELGTIPAEKTIQIAEQTGLIKPLTLWVLDTAIHQCALWQDQGTEIRVAVNLSALNLHDVGLARTIVQRLEHWHVPAHKLELEITESVMMGDLWRAVEVLSELDSMGIRIAVDDFGTGFSSLAYLKRLPVDELKIHKSFVMDMVGNENDEVIVRSTIDLAHNLGLEVVAEGVQDQPTLDRLQKLGCDTAQGYLFSAALSAEEFTQWLSNRQCTVQRKPRLVAS